MLTYVITRNTPAKVEYARTWKEAETLAEILFNQATVPCQIIVAEILSIKSTKALRSKK